MPREELSLNEIVQLARKTQDVDLDRRTFQSGT
jgi:hypothetical protein